MIRFCLMFLFLGFSAYSQSLSLRIDSISVDDQDPAERTFIVYYHLENLTDQPLHFLQDTTGIVPSTGGSGTYFPFYKIYEKDTFLEIGNVFSGWGRKQINLEEMDDSKIGEFQKKRANGQNTKKLISDKWIEMVPREIIKFSMDFHWDRNRYYQHHDMEYYLEEEVEHFIEITMVMQRPNPDLQLLDPLLEKRTNDSNFVEGVFTSNKHLIDFRKF